MRTPDATGHGPADGGRRRFLELCIGVFTALISIAVGVPFVGAIVGGRSRARRGPMSRAIRLEALPVDRPMDVAFTERAYDAYVRQETVRHVWVLRRSATDVVVYSPVCPHLGCRYDWDPAGSRFRCPCHGSVFTADGRVVSGPSPRPLDTLPAEVRDGDLYVEWEQFEIGTPRKRAV